MNQTLSFQAETIDLANLANRGKLYRSTVNPRGEVPALRLDDGRVVIEITAVCEYFDEMAAGGRSLIGETPEERATVRMWTRRVDMEIAQPMVAWWRGGAVARMPKIFIEATGLFLLPDSGTIA